MKKIISIFLTTLLFLSSMAMYCHAEDRVKIYVSVNAEDGGDGSEAKPFNSIKAAQDAVRRCKDRTNKTIEVILREGTYVLDKGIYMDERDSGSEEHNVIYRAYDNEKVIISGAKEITYDKLSANLPQNIKSRLKPEVRDKVFMIDLEDLGIDSVDPELQDCYTAAKHPKAWEKGRVAVYGGEGKLTLARYPNEGSFVKTGKIINPGSMNEGTIPVFEYNEDVISTWENTGDIWMWGKWSSDWNPTRNQIAEIDAENKVITCVLPPHQNVVKTEKEMYYYNVLEEIDVPGEICIDRKNLKIYIYPPENVEESFYFTSLDDHAFRLDKAENIQFRNLIMQGTRKTCFYALDSNNITLDGCEVRYITNSGVEFRGGAHNTFKNSEIHDVEYEGIYIDAGEIDYLENGYGLITNNHIYRFGGAEVNYTGAVEFEGVGITVSHNLIHDAVSMAITFEPSVDCVIEYNEIYDAARYLNDVALVYDYKDLVTRDVIVRYNLLYNSHERKRLTHTGNYGLYWDGSGHGKVCYGNIFYNLNRGVMLNCGGFTYIENNIFIDVDNPIRTTGNTSDNEAWGLWYEKTDNNPERYTKGVWKMEYPVIAKDYFAGKEGTGPNNLYRDNYIGDNIMYHCGENDIVKTGRNYIRPDIIIEEDIFEDYKTFNFNIIEGKCPENFDDIIDVDKIGLLD